MEIKQGNVMRASAIDTLRIKVGVDDYMRNIIGKRIRDYSAKQKIVPLLPNNIGDKKAMHKNPFDVIYMLKFCASALGIQGFEIKSIGIRPDNKSNKTYDYEVTVNTMEFIRSLRRAKNKISSSRFILSELMNSTIFAYIKADSAITITHLDYMTHLDKVTQKIFKEIYSNEILNPDIDFNEVDAEYLFTYIAAVATTVFSLSGLFVKLFEIDSYILSINIKEKYNLENSPHLYYRLLACMNMLDVLSNTDSSSMNLGVASVALDNIRKYEIQKDSSRTHITIDPNRDPSSYIVTEKYMGNNEFPYAYSLFPYDRIKDRICVDKSSDTQMHRMVQPSYCIDDLCILDDGSKKFDGTISLNTYVNVSKLLHNMDRKNNAIRKEESSDDTTDSKGEPVVFTHVMSPLFKNLPEKFEYGYGDIYNVFKPALDQIVGISEIFNSRNRFRRFTKAIHLGVSVVFYEKVNFVINNPKYIRRAYPALAILSLQGYMGSMIDAEQLDIHKGVVNYIHGAMRRNKDLEMITPDCDEQGEFKYLTIRKVINYIEDFFKKSEDSSKYIIEAQYIITTVILATSKSIFMTPMDDDVYAYWSKLLFTLFNIDFKTIESNPTVTGKVKRAIKAKYGKWINDTYNPLEENYVISTKILDPVLSAKLFKSILDNSILSKKQKNMYILKLISKI